MMNIDRTKDIVKMRKAGCTFQLIGTKYGISRQRVVIRMENIRLANEVVGYSPASPSKHNK